MTHIVDYACLPPPATSRLPPLDPSFARAYLEQVYPTAQLSAISDTRLAALFFSRQWFYSSFGDAVPSPPQWSPSLLDSLSLIQPSRYRCDDGFFSGGLLQRDAASRFPDILPCVPGTDCVIRQNMHAPACAGAIARRGSDVWVEVWHLAFDGRTRPRHRPKGWSEFLDHGPSGWWYIHAPGSGVFYHAGRTLAAPSKAAMLAALLEEWHASGRGADESSKPPGARKGSKGGGGSGGKFERGGKGGGGGRGLGERDGDAEIRRLIHGFTMGDPLAFARTFRKLEHGVPCKNVSWGRWRCVGDFIPSDTFDPLLLSLGRALRYDSLMLTALMWGRVLGSTQRLLALAQNRPMPLEAPYTPIIDGELTSEIVDLRMPPPPYGTRAVLPDEYILGSGPTREAFASAWAAEVLNSSPPRLSLRDPLAVSDESRATRCAFNASGGPTVRLACEGHVSWRLRDETQHQQTCTRVAPPPPPGEA